MCVYILALFIQEEQRMRLIILLSVAILTAVFFPTLYHKPHDFQ